MASNVKQSPIPVVPRNLKMVNADGTPTRSGQLLLEQLQAPSATAGTHGDRPNPGDVPEGSLYYENDRGVLYASTLGVWQYVAGTMYGTLSPVDERPTDLGTHDAGFDFRTIVAPAREFLWSQTAWIEVTPVQYGPHSARPDPATIVQGALYVEGDRGGVIYQVESPAGTNIWQYLAGTMWGTLVPDQRPTGLGTHDAGFDFRSTDPPPREFIWNQTAWVEVTPIPQTPWASNIDGGGFNLSNVNQITAQAYLVGGLRVVGPRLAGIAAPSGGTTVDAQARAAIQSIINTLSSATGGHGLIA